MIHSKSERQLLVNHILHKIMDLFSKISGHDMFLLLLLGGTVSFEAWRICPPREPTYLISPNFVM